MKTFVGGMNIFCMWKRQVLWGQGAECYEPNVFVFLKLICWRPNLKYNAISRWALWGVIGLWWLEHGALGWDPSPCKKKLQLSLSLSAREDAKKRGLFADQEEGFHWESNLPTLSTWTSQAPELRKTDVCRYGILL